MPDTSIDAAQPSIVERLGIEPFAEPVSDHKAFSAMFADPSVGPAALHAEGFHGDLGEMCRLIQPNVPWDVTGFLLQTLVGIGNYIGYRFNVAEEARPRRANLQLCLVGATASGKGTSLGWTENVMNQLDSAYWRDRALTSVSSAEGLIVRITDPVIEVTPKGEEKVVIEGSADKRAVWVEEELGSMFSRMDSLEKTLTKLWDSGRVETATKRESMACDRPHVSIIGHITPDELVERLDSHNQLLSNGFSNRFLYGLVRPVQVKFDSPSPEEIPGFVEVRDRLCQRLRYFKEDADDELVFSPEAHQLYLETARHLHDHPQTGAMAKQDARWRPMTFKLAIVFAAMDFSTTIQVEHYAAARAVFAYASRSARAFMGNRTGSDLQDRFIDMWAATGYRDLTTGEVLDMFSRNINATRRDRMLTTLQRDGFLTRQVGESTGGRPPVNVIYTADKRPSHPTTTQW